MRRMFYILLALTLLTACAPVVSASPTITPSATLTPQPTATATLIPLVEILPDLKIPANQIDGYYARDASGKLLATKDLYGNWLKAPVSGTEIPAATKAARTTAWKRPKSKRLPPRNFHLKKNASGFPGAFLIHPSGINRDIFFQPFFHYGYFPHGATQ